ncbi:uncharacterized protein LOC129952644 isoform X2 [Eupeodes corollae]|uniref:uncharacterized protein LOC129952644 isoform X2 n=1 Tax=Eupeodes corollae TaxID=290404 RepID=UPI00249015A8|nr:uncharacterized protein LOC129952644 isoform X2 [Eupeodes corollae]
MLHLENNKCKRINPRQKQILYGAMATNRKILDCITGDSQVRQTRQAVWRKLARELNQAGPEKDISQWRKVWTDLRLGMRKKWDKAQKSEYMLTEYESRVIEACEMIEKPGDEDFNEKSAEEINSFLAFLEEDVLSERVHDNSDYYKEDNSNSSSYYLADSSEFITRCSQPPDSKRSKNDFYYEPDHFVDYDDDNSVEYISDDDQTPTKSEDRNFREPSVECISDDEEPVITNGTKSQESPAHLSNEEEEPLLTEIIPQAMPFHETLESETAPESFLLQSPELHPVPSASKIVHRRQTLKNATFKEIRKMHRNLLNESRKQTALLRKLVQGMKK